MENRKISQRCYKIVITRIRFLLVGLTDEKEHCSAFLSFAILQTFFWDFMNFSIYHSLLKGLRDMNRFTAFMRIEILDQFVMNLDASLNSSWTWGNRMIVSFFLLNTTTQILQYYSHELENVAFFLLVTNLKKSFLCFCNLCCCAKTYVMNLCKNFCNGKLWFWWFASFCFLDLEPICLLKYWICLLLQYLCSNVHIFYSLYSKKFLRLSYLHMMLSIDIILRGINVI